MAINTNVGKHLNQCITALIFFTKVHDSLVTRVLSDFPETAVNFPCRLGLKSSKKTDFIYNHLCHYYMKWHSFPGISIMEHAEPTTEQYWSPNYPQQLQQHLLIVPELGFMQGTLSVHSQCYFSYNPNIQHLKQQSLSIQF